MALTQVTGPYPIFTDLDGMPLDDGYLYIGAINQDPEQNPIQVFWDSNLTIPATQPIRTSNGYAYRNGTPALLYTAGEFSITIRNKREEFVLYSPVGYGFDPAAVSASVVKNDFIGDGVEVDFTLSAAPSTILATNVFINGVYQEKDSYTLFGNVITFSIAPPLNSSIEVMTNETGVINSGNATAITYTLTAPGAVQQTVQTRLEQYISVKDFGAVGDGVTDDQAAIQAAIDYAKATPGIKFITFPTANYLVGSEIEIKGGFGDGLTVEGNKSTVTGTHNGPVFDLNGTLPAPAPEYRLNVLIRDFTIVGSGKANTGSRCVQIVNGANVQINNCILQSAYKGLYGFGALICNFIQLNIRDNDTGVEFVDTPSFSPNDIHFVNCQIIANTRAVRAINFDYGSWNFYGCEIEGNNYPGGTAVDGVRVCEFFGAGEVNFIGCHFEANYGQYNLFYDSPNGRHLNIIGCKMVPGDSAGSVIYIDNGELFVTGTHAAQNVGGNIVLTANTDSALIVGDTAGTVTGTLSKLTRIRNGNINVANANPGAFAPGIASKGSSGIGIVVEGDAQFNDAAGARLGYLGYNNAVRDGAGAYSIVTGTGQAIVTRSAGIGLEPSPDNTLSLGSGSLRWSQVFAANGTINTSDERAKQQIEPIPQAWLDAWGEVDFMRYKMNDAVAEKGDGARWHIGLIAQRVKEAFEAKGVDPFAIGILCWDEWDDVEVDQLVDGVMQKQIVRQAGEQYGIRYEQALALECAYLRSKIRG
jgi:hypothetical protein